MISDFIIVQKSCSAVRELYLKNPIAATGSAAIMQSQLAVSLPKMPFKPKYVPTAMPIAASEQTNCLVVSPKNTASL